MNKKKISNYTPYIVIVGFCGLLYYFTLSTILFTCQREKLMFNGLMFDTFSSQQYIGLHLSANKKD
jgi:hypothetical protein